MIEKVRQLNPIYVPHSDFDAVEERIRQFFRREIYLPAMASLSIPQATLQNSPESDLSALTQALARGSVTFNRGRFSGTFSASTRRALKALGAEFDRHSLTYRLLSKDLPPDVMQASQVSAAHFAQKVSDLDEKLGLLAKKATSKAVSFSDLFDKTLFRVDKEFRTNVKGLALVPQLTDAEAQLISKEWATNLNKHVKTFVDEQVLELRRNVQKAVEAGDRYGSLVGEIRKSYGVSLNKAKFLGRQETKLMTSKYQEARYTEAGVEEYRWKCVAGSAAHPVRPSHKRLDNTIQRWDRPPVTTAPDEPERHNNPGEDYGCRCFPIPIVRF